jgi:hypothetical protein
MRKKFFYLVAMITTFVFTANAQDCTDVTLTVGGGSYDSEISWSIDETENYAGTHELCLEDGLYTFNMFDSWGDGWNGGTFSITDAEGNLIASGGLDTGASGSVDFTLGDVAVSGCTDPLYLEYYELATEDDGSCMTIIVLGCTDESAMNYNSSANIDDGSCAWECPLTPGGVDVTETTCYDYVWNYGYSIEEMESFGYDCSCVEAPINGCMDPDASNYDETANQAGSCTYDCADNETELELTMNDSYGDGWNGATMTIGGLSFTGPASDTETTLVCVDLSACNAIVVGGGSYDSEIGWTLGVSNNLNINNDMSGGAPFEGEIGNCPVLGCTDWEASNWTSLADTDDGSCIYPEPCAPVDFTFVNTGSNMTWFSPYGIGTGTIGAFVGDMCVGSTEIAGGAIQIAIWGDDPNTDEVDGAIDGDIVTLVFQSPDNPNSLQNDAGVYSSGFSFVYQLNGIEVMDDYSDVSWSFECSGTAEVGCMDPDAFNYYPDAIIDDGSCEDVVEGCVDYHYLEYNPDANVSDYDQCITGKLMDVQMKRI